MAFPNYTYPAYGAYNPVTPFAPAPQVYQPQQPTQQGIKGQFQRQTAIAADLCRRWGEHRLAHGQQRRARLLLVGVGDARQRKRRETVRVGEGTFLNCGYIRAITGDPFLRFCDLFRKALADGVLQRVFLGKMVGFQQLQLGHLNIQIHLFFDHRVAAGQCFDLGIRKRLLIHIFGGANRRFAGHDLADKFLLALHKLVKVGVEGALGDISHGQAHAVQHEAVQQLRVGGDPPKVRLGDQELGDAEKGVLLGVHAKMVRKDRLRHI